MLRLRHLLSLLALLSLLGLSTRGYAQMNTVTVSLQKAKLVWSWALGTRGAVEYFLVRCTQVGSPVPVVGPKTLPTVREQKLTDIVTTPGEYTCVTVAGNSYGESGPSPSVTFRAGDVPLPASTLSLITGSEASRSRKK